MGSYRVLSTKLLTLSTNDRVPHRKICVPHTNDRVQNTKLLTLSTNDRVQNSKISGLKRNDRVQNTKLHTLSTNEHAVMRSYRVLNRPRSPQTFWGKFHLLQDTSD